MKLQYIIGVALLFVPLVMTVRLWGWRRGSLTFLDILFRWVLLVGPPQFAETRIILVLLMIYTSIAYWLGNTALEMINFMVLQWLGLRIDRTDGKYRIRAALPLTGWSIWPRNVYPLGAE